MYIDRIIDLCRLQKASRRLDAQVVYSLMVDRFANGDLSNDQRNIPSFQKQEGIFREVVSGSDSIGSYIFA